MRIKLLKLKSGEDVIGDILKENAEFITVGSPAVLMPVGEGRAGAVQIGLVPWVPFSEAKSFEIKRDWVVLITDPSIDIVNNYNQIFGSGIVMPQVNTKSLLQE